VVAGRNPAPGMGKDLNMKPLLSLALAAALVASAAQPALADGEFMSARDLKIGLEGWTSEDSDEIVRDSAAFGYVIGVHDALSGALICSGEDVTKGMVVQAVLKYMRANPSTLDKSGDTVVVEALKRVWPCKGE
jgi:hypothetical protein